MEGRKKMEGVVGIGLKAREVEGLNRDFVVVEVVRIGCRAVHRVFNLMHIAARVEYAFRLFSPLRSVASSPPKLREVAVVAKDRPSFPAPAAPLRSILMDLAAKQQP
jgi:hypothetical protein